MQIIDTHSHLYLEPFDSDRTLVMQRAIKSGIIAILLPNIDVTTMESLFHVCDQFPENVWPMMGLHPTSVDGSYTSQLSRMEKMLTRRAYCGIGEIGIDLYWDQQYLKEQKKVFEEQLQWSISMQLPVSIHTRNAYDEVFDSIHKVGYEQIRGVFHCFSGSATDLEEIKRLSNFKIGIDGNITYPKSPLPEILQQTTLEMLLLETDSPYLAPLPYRGKRNEPFYLWETARKLADIYQTDLEIVANQTSNNALDLFDIKK